jgi:hypothetical protein
MTLTGSLAHAGMGATAFIASAVCLSKSMMMSVKSIARDPQETGIRIAR